MGKSSSPLSSRRRVQDNDDESRKKLRRTEDARRNSGSEDEEEHRVRVPLSEVVSECIKRWFQDTLKEAKTGDINMQVIVGQMYSCGYGVTRNVDKGNFWLSRAARMRPSVWKVNGKRPGYNASDSDSDSDSESETETESDSESDSEELTGDS